MDRLHLGVAVSAMVVAVALTPGAMAAEATGIVISMTPSAVANGAVGERRLSVNAPIFLGDSIATSAVGEALLWLRDQTKLVVGPRSVLLIDEFVFNSTGRADKVTLNAVRGALRFITGNARKQAYTIKSPTATIGIRGTKFDFTAALDGTSYVAPFEGEVIVCDRRRRHCAALGSGLGSGCSLASVGPDGEAKRVPIEQRQRIIDEYFPFIRDQPRRPPSGFHVDTSACNIK